MSQKKKDSHRRSSRAESRSRRGTNPHASKSPSTQSGLSHDSGSDERSNSPSPHTDRRRPRKDREIPHTKTDTELENSHISSENLANPFSKSSPGSTHDENAADNKPPRTVRRLSNKDAMKDAKLHSDAPVSKANSESPSSFQQPTSAAPLSDAEPATPPPAYTLPRSHDPTESQDAQSSPPPRSEAGPSIKSATVAKKSPVSRSSAVNSPPPAYDPNDRAPQYPPSRNIPEYREKTAGEGKHATISKILSKVKEDVAKGLAIVREARGKMAEDVHEVQAIAHETKACATCICATISVATSLFASVILWFLFFGSTGIPYGSLHDKLWVAQVELPQAISVIGMDYDLFRFDFWGEAVGHRTETKPTLTTTSPLSVLWTPHGELFGAPNDAALSKLASELENIAKGIVGAATAGAVSEATVIASKVTAAIPAATQAAAKVTAAFGSAFGLKRRGDPHVSLEYSRSNGLPPLNKLHRRKADDVLNLLKDPFDTVKKIFKICNDTVSGHSDYFRISEYLIWTALICSGLSALALIMSMPGLICGVWKWLIATCCGCRAGPDHRHHLDNGLKAHLDAYRNFEKGHHSIHVICGFCAWVNSLIFMCSSGGVALGVFCAFKAVKAANKSFQELPLGDNRPNVKINANFYRATMLAAGLLAIALLTMPFFFAALACKKIFCCWIVLLEKVNPAWRLVKLGKRMVICCCSRAKGPTSHLGWEMWIYFKIVLKNIWRACRRVPWKKDYRKLKKQANELRKNEITRLGEFGQKVDRKHWLRRAQRDGTLLIHLLPNALDKARFQRYLEIFELEKAKVKNAAEHVPSIWPYVKEHMQFLGADVERLYEEHGYKNLPRPKPIPDEEVMNEKNAQKNSRKPDVPPSNGS